MEREGNACKGNEYKENTYKEKSSKGKALEENEYIGKKCRYV
jgi:hypothetical protein